MKIMAFQKFGTPTCGAVTGRFSPREGAGVGDASDDLGQEAERPAEEEEEDDDEDGEDGDGGPQGAL